MFPERSTPPVYSRTSGVQPTSQAAPTAEGTASTIQPNQNSSVLQIDANLVSMPTDLSVKGSALGESVQCLVDTGAAISVVSYEFLQKTPAGRKLTLTDSPVKSVNTVSGEKLIVMGQVSLPIKIQSNPYECDAHVISNLGYDVVLGRDFLRKTKAVINLGEHTLYLQPSQDTPTPADAHHSVKALATYVIPPRSETIIPGKIPDATADSQGIVEAIPRLVERYNLHGAAVLATVSPNQTVPVRLLNGNADAISRRPKPPLAALDTPGPQLQRIHDLQRRDPDLSDIIRYLETEELPTNTSLAQKLFHQIDDCYLDDHGLLCHLWTPTGRRRRNVRAQLFIPAALKHEILLAGHDDPTAGHLGIFKTYEKLRLRYYWRGMFQDVQHWCRSCVHCAMKKTPRARHKAPLLPIPVEGAFDRVAVDCVGPFPPSKSGNRYLVVFSDYLTRWPEAFAVPTIDAPVIARLFVDEIIGRHGAPRTLLSDRGQNFMSRFIREVCKITNTEKVNTTAYHPQTDGLVERLNGTLVQSLSMYVSTNQKDWDQHLQSVLLAYRVSPSETTGESPFYLLYGRDPRLPLDVSLLAPSPDDLTPSVAEHRARIVRHIEEAQEMARSNIQRAQQRMKLQYDQHATLTDFAIGQRVWAFTPKTKKGLSRKLLHNWHGPYRVIQKLSPAHYLLRTATNNRVTTAVHVNRLKPYYDPSDRPLQVPPEDDLQVPYLAEHELPDDSFGLPEGQNQPTPEPQPIGQATPPNPPAQPENSADPTAEMTSGDETLDDANVYQVERILKTRTRRDGTREYLIKWQGYSSRQNTWKPEANILDKQLLADFRKANASTPAITSLRAPLIASLTPSSPTSSKPGKSSQLAQYFNPTQAIFYALFLFISILLVFPTPTLGYGYNSAHQRVVYYPGSLMVSHHSKAAVFYSDTTLVNVQASLGAPTYGSELSLTANCSTHQKMFLNHILDSTRSIQRVVHRLLSMQGATNLIECDSYLRRFYFYATGLTSTMVCPRTYRSSLAECKSWALRQCLSISPEQKLWLRGRSRRSSWMCHAGFFGLFRTIYESTGHDCESSHVTGLKTSLWAILGLSSTTRHMIETVNGKTVILTKITDSLHTKVISLISSLHDVQLNFRHVEGILSEEFKKHDCLFATNLEFLSKYSTELNRALASILRLIEIEDIVKQTLSLSDKDLVGYNLLPQFVAHEISTRLSAFSKLTRTATALRDGFSLLLQPMVDYAYDYRQQLLASLLFTVPTVDTDNDFCVLEYLTPLTYNISGKCYTGPMARSDLALVSCPDRRFQVPVSALGPCFQDDNTLVCPHSVLRTIHKPDWLGIPWTPSTQLSFPRMHTPTADCSTLNPLIHLGGRHYLSTTSSTLPVQGLCNRSTVDLTPLMVYHFPCEVTFAAQQTGFGSCPDRLEINVPVFTPTHITYIPWHSAMDDSVVNFHLQSLHIPPASVFNRSTLDSLDDTFHSLDGRFTEQFARAGVDIGAIRETLGTTLNDVLTYCAFGLAFLDACCICIMLCYARRMRYLCDTPQTDIAARTLAAETVGFVPPQCGTCHRPRRQTSAHL